MKSCSYISWKKSGPAIAIIASALFVYYHVLRPDVLIYGMDTVFHDYIMQMFGLAKLRSGNIPAWMPYIYCGIPFIGSFAFCPFYPPALLSLLVPLPSGFNLQYFLHNILAGFFMYRMLRSFRISRFPAIFGAVAFQLSGHFVTLSYPGHLQKFQAIAWIPLSFYCLHKAMMHGKKRYFILLGFSAAMPLLTSHPQIYYYSMASLFLYFLWRIGNRKRKPLPMKLKRMFPLFACACFFSLGLSAVQVLPGIEASNYSVRGGGMTFQQTLKSSYPPGELPELFLPRFKGDSIRGGYGRYLGEWGERLVSDYLGMAAVILALLGITLSVKLDKFYFMFLFLLSMIISTGGYSPVYRVFYDIIPGMKYFRSPATVMFLMSFSVAALAAFGLEAVLKKWSCTGDDKEKEEEKALSPEKKNLRRVYMMAAAAGLLLLAALMASGYHARVSENLREVDAMEPGSRLFYEKAFFISAAIRRSLFFSFLAMVSLAFLLFLKSQVRKKILPRKAIIISQILFILFFVTDVGLNNRAFVQAEPIETYHNYLFNAWPEPVLRGESRPLRLLEIGNELSNRHILSEIGSPLGYHPIEMQHYLDAWNASGPGSLKSSKLTSTEYIVAEPEFNPERKAALIDRRQDKSLFKWKTPIRYAWVPERVSFISWNENIQELISPDTFDPYRESYIESSSSGDSWEREGPDENYDLEYVTYDTDMITISCDFQKAAYVVTSEVWMPGWRASLENGAPLPMFRANGAFRCFRMPRGKNLVIMQYRPQGLKWGMIISIVTLALGIGLLLYLRQFQGETE